MLELVLTNGKEDLHLLFSIRNTEIAKKWFTELATHNKLNETDRFSNWGNITLIQELNQIIDEINEYEFIIDKKVSEHTTQQELNYLHKFFEDLRGEVFEKTIWFINAPKHIQQSVDRFNVLIHQLESELRTKNKHPTVVVTFSNSIRHELSEEDIKYFTFKWEFGTVYINYCHVGKTVLDVYKDNDSITEAIRPQTHYSSDFMIKFGPSTNLFVYLYRKLMIHFWLLTKHFKLKNLNIGMIPVANLKSDIEYKTLLKFNKVKEVKCLK
jgi:hypothetical protein